MSSVQQSNPVTRRVQGGLAIAVGVFVAIVVAVTLIAVTGSSNPTQPTSASPSNPTPRPSTVTSQANAVPTPHIQYLGSRQAGAVVNGGSGPAAAVGNTTSKPTVQPNPDQQGITPKGRGENLPGWLLR
jgi:hypothetical protein